MAAVAAAEAEVCRFGSKAAEDEGDLGSDAAQQKVKICSFRILVQSNVNAY